MHRVYYVIFGGLQVGSRLMFWLPTATRQAWVFETGSWLSRWIAPRWRAPRKEPGAHWLHLGCGNRLFPGFVNVDFFSGEAIEYHADLRYPLRLPDESMAGIFSEHTFEHLSYAEIRRLLTECFRVLIPGGRLRIVVPDVSVLIQAYVRHDDAFFANWRRLMLTESRDAVRRAWPPTTPMQAISFVTQEYGHLSCWDFQTAESLLAEAGFVAVKQHQYGQGDCPQLLHDRPDADRVLVSLYVEGRKPEGKTC